MAATITSGRAFTCLLERDPSNVARARDLARQALGEWQLGDMADIAALIVSELVTNSLRHGEGPVSVRLSYASSVLWTEVHDHGTGRPVRRNASADDEDGRGLALLGDLAELHRGELGVIEDDNGPGKTVYVTLAAPATTTVAARDPVTAIAGEGPTADKPQEPAPGLVLAALRDGLAASGVTVTGMTLTRLRGTLNLTGGFSVECRSGWLWWQSGRLSGNGRPLHAIHPATDPAGAARRLAARS